MGFNKKVISCSLMLWFTAFFSLFIAVSPMPVDPVYGEPGVGLSLGNLFALPALSFSVVALMAFLFQEVIRIYKRDMGAVLELGAFAIIFSVFLVSAL